MVGLKLVDFLKLPAERRVIFDAFHAAYVGKNFGYGCVFFEKSQRVLVESKLGLGMCQLVAHALTGYAGVFGNFRKRQILVAV